MQRTSHLCVTTISNESKRFRFIDLFAGIGLQMWVICAGRECLTSEFDKFSAQTYSTWFGDA